MSGRTMPKNFEFLQSDLQLPASDIMRTTDDFFIVCKSVSDLLSRRNILDFPNLKGKRLACDHFFDDWFLYAVPNENDYVYGLLKLREQEHDAESKAPADGDTPGVTVSFISFDCDVLLLCLADPADENRSRLNDEINRVVACKGQRHHKAIKAYFINPQSEGAYLVANLYVKRIAAFAEDGVLEVPEHYKNMTESLRLPRFIESLNQAAGYVLCDHEKIYVQNHEEPSVYETLAILATHTGNTSFWSFAAEVEYHARYLTSFAKIKIPFLGKSIYDSAIRADMTVGDPEYEGPAPFHQDNSKIVKRQFLLHQKLSF